MYNGSLTSKVCRYNTLPLDNNSIAETSDSANLASLAWLCPCHGKCVCMGWRGGNRDEHKVCEEIAHYNPSIVFADYKTCTYSLQVLQAPSSVHLEVLAYEVPCLDHTPPALPYV